AGVGRDSGDVRLMAVGPAAGHVRRTAQAGVRDGPLHRRADEDRGIVDARAAAPTSAAAAVDLVAVVLVVGNPVDVVEGLVVVAQGMVVVVPELLQALLFGRQALVALGEDVVPRLIAAVREGAPAGAGGAVGAQQADQRPEDQGEPFHRDSFHWLTRESVAGKAALTRPLRCPPCT